MILQGKSLFWSSVLVVSIIFGATSLFIQAGMPVNIDVSAHLSIAKSMLAGNVLYQDIVVINPPFQYVFRMMPVLLSSWLSVSVVRASIAWDMLWLVLIYIMTMYCIFCVSSRLKGKLSGWPLFFLFLLPLAYINYLSSATLYGEKEHYVLAIMVLYVFFSYARCQNVVFGKAFRVATMLAMAVACMMKPFFMLIVPLAELYVAKRTAKAWWRSAISLEVVIFAAMGIGYLAAVWIFFPSYFDVLSDFSLAYKYFDRAPEGALWYYLLDVFFVIFCVFMGWFLVKDTTFRELYVLQYMALLVCSVAVFLQQKLWAYHFYPFSGIAALLVMTTLVALLSLLRWVSMRRVTVVLVNIVFLSASAAFLLSATKERYTIEDATAKELIHAMKAQVDDPSVYVISPTIVFCRMALTEPIIWHNKYYHVWPLVGVLQEEVKQGNESAYTSKIKTRVIDAMAKDITRLAPDYVVVFVLDIDSTYDLPDALSANNAFNKAMLVYEEEPAMASDLYRVYRLRADLLQ